MEVIRHEAICWAEQPLAGSGVQHEFPKGRVKPVVQQSFPAHGNR
jgi:hypothetical protein